MIPYSRPKRSDLYTLSQSKLLDNHTLHSGTAYLYSAIWQYSPPPPHGKQARVMQAPEEARESRFLFLLLVTPLLSSVTLSRYSSEIQNITPALQASHLFSFTLLLISNDIMLDNYRARNCQSPSRVVP